MEVEEINYEDFAKLDLRVAQIIQVEEIIDADKLYKIHLDVGEEIGKRIVCAGIKKYYSKEELIGLKVVYLSNLKSRKLKGVESQGMLFAAFTDDNSIVNLLNPGDIPVGNKVG